MERGEVRREGEVEGEGGERGGWGGGGRVERGEVREERAQEEKSQTRVYLEVCVVYMFKDDCRRSRLEREGGREGGRH